MKYVTKLLEMLERILAGLIIAFILVLIYKYFNPYAYPELENRMLYVLVSIAIIILFLLSYKYIYLLYEYIVRLLLHKYTIKIISLAFLGMFPIVVIQSVYPQPEWVSILIPIVAIIFVIVTLYIKRNRLGDIEEEAIMWEYEEKARETEFAWKYPGIEQVWGLRRISKLIYKEGVLAILILTLLTIHGGFLIFHNLENPEFFQDEWWHVSTIKSLQEGQGFYLWNYLIDEPMYEYNRGKVLIWIVYQFSQFLGDDEFGLRFFPALIGTLLIPTIYFIFKRFIGKEASLLTCAIFSFNITALFLARFLRPYTIFLFSYLVLFYLCFDFIKSVHKRSVLRNSISILGILLSFIVALNSSEFAKLIISYTIIFYVGYLYYGSEKKISLGKKSYIFIGIVFISMYFLNYFNIINLSIIPRQLGETIGFDKIQNPTIEYYQYLFEKPFKLPFFSYTFFFTGIILLLFNFLNKKESKYLFFLMGSLIPLILMVYFFKYYEDFRYIYFLIPFIYGVIMLGFYWLLRNSFNNIYKFNTNSVMIFLMIILLTAIIYPIIPNMVISGFTSKGPSDWQGSDGQQYLHRRAVAPELKKAFDFIEQNITFDYALVVSDYRVKYLEKFKSKTVYYIDPTRNDKRFWIVNTMKGKKRNINDLNPESTSFQDILKKNDNVIIVIDNVHMINKDIYKFLYNNTTNFAKETKISKYNYDSFYRNKNLYWPNIFVYQK